MAAPGPACARRALLLLGAAVLLAACQPTLPDGFFSCTDDDTCPAGWVCVEQRCFSRDPRDAGAGEPVDAARPGDAGEPVDAAARVDAAGPGDAGGDLDGGRDGG
ncbi:MAG: hypothetical protein ACFCGT_27305 [Sandaracinaceae bacterium]